MENKVVAVIQARLGSTRLPGKVLMDIEGRPMLRHVVDRLRHCRLLDEVVIATTTDARDDALAAWCAENGVACFRGSEQDVLERYCGAADRFGADTVVRITSDCPLIDPEVVDRAVQAYLDDRDRLDGASSVLRRTYPRGLDTEVVSRATLERIRRTTREPRYREHVTLYIYEHPQEFRMRGVENGEDHSHLRWTVDEPSDLSLVREIYRRLYRPGEVFLMRDILALLEREPGLSDINRDIRQKKI